LSLAHTILDKTELAIGRTVDELVCSADNSGVCGAQVGE